MHICYLIAANEPHAYWWTRYFIERGHRVSVISYSKDEIEGADNYHIDSHFRGPLKYITTVSGVKALIRALKPDIVHAHYVTSQGFLALMSGFHPRMLSVWGSDIAVAPGKNPIMRMIVRQSLESADCINSPAEHITDKILNITDRIKRIETYQYGVDTAYIDTIEPQKKSAKFRIISTRNFKPIYNMEIVLKSVSELRRTRYDFDFIILGKGTDEQTMSIEHYIDKYKMHDYTYFPGFVPMDTVFSYLKSSDIFISIPDTDGTPISVLEGMYCGAFPVLSDIEANREIVNNNNALLTGLSENSIVSDIQYALENSKLRRQAAEFNRTLVNNKYKWLDNMKRTEQIYRDLMEHA
ncbi:MAG: glycosyltransferase [bacterium]